MVIKQQMNPSTWKIKWGLLLKTHTSWSITVLHHFQIDLRPSIILKWALRELKGPLTTIDSFQRRVLENLCLDVCPCFASVKP